MATSKRTTKARAEVEKARLKMVEYQAKMKELEAKQTEYENFDIVDIVRGMHIPLDDLAAVLASLKGSALPIAPTSGQSDPKRGKKAKAESTEESAVTDIGADETEADTNNNETEDNPE